MKQIPLVKLSTSERTALDTQLYETIGRLEERQAKEKERRGDWNKATATMQKDISKIAKKLREDDAAPSAEESSEDRKTAEEIAARMVGNDETETS